MSKEFKDHTTTTKALQEMKCDMCGKTSDRSDWIVTEPDSYPSERMVETIIKINDTSRTYCADYGGDSKNASIDLCPDCFRQKLIPFLESQGVKIHVEEYDW